MKSANKKFARTSGTLSLAILAAFASSSAVAETLGWYGGANVGQSRAKIDTARITSGLQAGGFATSGINVDERATGYKLFGGYQFNKNFSLEGGYFDLGQFGYTATTQPPGSLISTIKLRGINMDAVGTLPLSEKFSILGRAGLNYAQARDSFTGTGAVGAANPNPTKSQANYKLGLGLQYALSDSWAMRGEVERYRINDAVGNRGDIDLVSVGLIYRFGQKRLALVEKDTTPPFVTLAVPYNATMGNAPYRNTRVAFSEGMDPDTINSKTVILSHENISVAGAVLATTPTTATFAQTANLAPNMVYTGRVIAGANGVKDLAGNAMESDYVWSFKTAAIVEPKYIIFDKFVMLGDTHFQFDKANLSPAGEELLKQDIKIMQDNPNLKVRIAGYASASGSVAHNQDLSERRAESVMSYMILQGNLAADRFDTIGYGNTRPANYESNPSDINSKAARSNMRVLFEVIAK